jgi:uncharacterized membrane protein
VCEQNFVYRHFSQPILIFFFGVLFFLTLVKVRNTTATKVKMHGAQRRQLVVGSAVAVTVGIVLYHVFFRKPNSISLADAKDRSESKQGILSFPSTAS